MNISNLEYIVTEELINIGSNIENSFRALNINVRSLQKNKDELINLVRNAKITIHAIIATECWLKDSTNVDI